ncbi:MAG: uridine kinase [Acidimicrobiia bacterium]|nr:uridine kinase [Acidimicrobiia bacterium]
MADDRGRQEMLRRLVELIEQRAGHETLCVAIDGIDAAGKTRLADELAGLLEADGVPVLRASIDGFHYPAEIRHLRRAEDPARSYYEDSFDYGALIAFLLEPLVPKGDHVIRTRVFDFRTDTAVHEPPTRVARGTVLLFDGVFLLTPELERYWGLSVFVEVDPVVSVQRAMSRDKALFGTAEATEKRYHERYLPGQQLYLSAVRPHHRADVVIDNNDPTGPVLERMP